MTKINVKKEFVEWLKAASLVIGIMLLTTEAAYAMDLEGFTDGGVDKIMKSGAEQIKKIFTFISYGIGGVCGLGAGYTIGFSQNMKLAAGAAGGCIAGLAAPTILSQAALLPLL